MPQSERSEAADALHQAFLVNLIAESEAQFQEAMDSSGSSDSGSEGEEERELLQSRFGDTILHTLADLYSKHYLKDRGQVPKSRHILRLLLTEWKNAHPDIFRSYVRINADCFDDLVNIIKDDPVFHSNSNNSQMPVEEQVAIALYRFGHYGNAASTMKVALHFGIGYGTVRIVTMRVMAAICTERFRQSALRWSNETEQEAAKQWVEEQSCPAWRNGWLMVDGTLVPLFERPELYGNTFYDRKSNYSLNVQIISTPNLRIIDYGVGLPGSQHDATAWKSTRIPQEHETLLGAGEWVWGDSAYPLQTWCQAPYKKPESDDPINTQYNYYVSRVRIRSEHCMGFLKGRWSSLRGLRVHIHDQKSMQYATYWVTTCILLHSFAMEHEDSSNFSKDEFLTRGISILRNEQASRDQWMLQREEVTTRADRTDTEREVELLEGRIKREELKIELFRYLNLQ